MITEANAATPQTDTREPALITRAQAGDNDAFAELYTLHHSTVLAYVARKTANREIAEDITGETFLRAWLKLDTFTWRGVSFGGWLTTIAKNKITDHYRSAQRREFPVEDMRDRDYDALAPSPEETVLSGLDEAVVLQALEKLIPRQREVLTRRFLLECSVSETARVMGRSEGAVKTLQFRAMESLRASYLGVAA